MGPPETQDLLDDVSLLIYLDRVHSSVRPLVVEILDRPLKALGERLDTGPEDVGEPQEEGERDPLRGEVLRDLVQVQTPRHILGGVNGHMALLVDPEVAHAPALDVVQLEGIIYGPALL